MPRWPRVEIIMEQYVTKKGNDVCRLRQSKKKACIANRLRQLHQISIHNGKEHD